MYQQFEISIVTIVLEEVYSDGVIEAYEREALKKVLKQVGIKRELFQKLHKQISIEAKKKNLQPALNDEEGFLQRVSTRLTKSTTPEIALDLVTLLSKEFKLSIPDSTPASTNIQVERIETQEAPISHTQKPVVANLPSPITAPQFETTEREIVPAPKAEKPSKKQVSKQVKVSSEAPKKQTIATKKKKASKNDGNLKVSSPNYGIACYLLGSGSLSWMFVFALIPILMNLNVQELYTQHRYLSKTVTTVQGTILGNLFARNAFLDSEVVEVHYHYIKDGKNFTGHSYMLDTYKKSDTKVAVLVNVTNPKLSRLRDGSYYEYDVVIFIPLLALLFFFFMGLYGTINAKQTPSSELKMIGQDLNSILSHFVIRRLSIVGCTILFCLFFSVGNIFFNTLVPIINMIFVVGFVLVAIYGLIAAES